MLQERKDITERMQGGRVYALQKITKIRKETGQELR